MFLLVYPNMGQAVLAQADLNAEIWQSVINTFPKFCCINSDKLGAAGKIQA